MKFDELKQLIEENSKPIDPADVAVESSKIPYIHGRFVNILADLRIEEAKISFQMKKLIYRKWMWMTGKASDEQLKSWKFEPFQLKILKQDFDLMLEGDDEFAELSLREKENKTMIEMTLEMIKNLNNRNFVIKSMIDFMKMTNGVV